MNYYVGIDIGTTNIKGQLFDESGNIIAEISYISPKYEVYGIQFMDAREIKDIIFSILKHFAKTNKGVINAINFSSFGEAFVLLDKENNILTDFILFVSDLGDEEADYVIKNLNAEEIAKTAGVYPNRMYSFSKLMRLKKNKPEILKNSKHILLVGGYAAFLLTGKYYSDYSLASRTMLLDINNLRWNTNLINKLGFDINIFPSLCNLHDVVGEMDLLVKEELEISSPCLVFAGGHDQTLASVGNFVEQCGDTNDSTGTAECISIMHNHKSFNIDFYKNNFNIVPYIFKETYLTYSFIPMSGDLLSLLKRKISFDEGENGSFFDNMNSKFDSQPTSIYCLPYFSGTGTPELDWKKKGILIGLTSKTENSELYFSFMEGATFEIKFNIDLLSKFNIESKRIMVSGGGRKSIPWLKIKSSIFNQDLIVQNSSESGIFGCFLAMKHSVENVDYKDLFNMYKDKQIVFYKDINLANKYFSKYAKYLKIREITDDICKL